MKFMKTQFTGKERSQRSEKQAARFLNGRVQPASGALPVPSMKGDVRTTDFLVEDKTTIHDSFSIKVKTWRTTASHAYKNRLMPCMRINFAKGPTLYVLDEVSMGEFLALYNECRACERRI